MQYLLANHPYPPSGVPLLLLLLLGLWLARETPELLRGPGLREGVLHHGLSLGVAVLCFRLGPGEVVLGSGLSLGEMVLGFGLGWEWWSWASAGFGSGGPMLRAGSRSDSPGVGAGWQTSRLFGLLP